ncbi:serine/threonine-protein kinase [Haliangium ochraceum]|uniref:Serine/threonine protein kinase n=1 Tax=Haliangium ochraceum (strain DSM 14365 / JCM 11303 / SMP-2) TaxID=502025 RepID=D0LQ86_HALO1|nr:serine/threonine-protein kinase [Haliangium ochraceum]ACY18895.1 serine/threonine protein kinase [Haliangium ochraceum DSM 14365]
MARASSSALQAGSRIGDYELVAPIARGGFGVIWSGRHTLSQQPLAIKIIRAELISSDELVLRLEREARAIALTRHPNVVELYDFGKLEDGRPYLVMEHVPGVDLDSYLRSRGALAPTEVLSILAPLADALAAVHAQGIVHRDIKASNIMLSVRDGRRRVVLLDFGVAKLLEHRGQPITAPRSTVGTPQCMAPEQILGLPVDARTDVYALGSLAFQMLTGEPPFPGEDVTVTNAHLIAERPQPSARADITPAFDEVIVRAMHRFPEHRYESAPAFAEAFRAAMGSQTPQASHVRQAVGFYVDVQTSESLGISGEAYDDEMLDDMESVVPHASSFLREHGCLLAYENGNSALFVRPLDGGVAFGAAFRRETVDLAQALLDSLAAREQRSSQVAVSVHLHLGRIELINRTVTGGPLLDIPLWVTSISNQLRADILLGSAAVVANLDLPVSQISAAPPSYRIHTERDHA